MDILKVKLPRCRFLQLRAILLEVLFSGYMVNPKKHTAFQRLTSSPVLIGQKKHPETCFLPMQPREIQSSKNIYIFRFPHGGGRVSSADCFFHSLERKPCNIAFPLSSVINSIEPEKYASSTPEKHQSPFALMKPRTTRSRTIQYSKQDSSSSRIICGWYHGSSW